ncbi:cupin domain-containing protein [Pseudomonas benzenivorans]|uniref:Cupin domain-containing protein n=1 Tax=Pseudomonas benzenivorans TaxID=556533 RepID=A0ABZ0Q105_9PSED|nr:cupin domain-containing protein [Pseudomonas benzenivorans]WPC06427.1 cupin domain-containing protein [Pseudomonas benzenivorans]
MRINADLDRRVVLDTHALAWQASPLPGVERRPLERFAAESGRATSIVRYAPGSAFSRHLHPGGEEILVLEGVFVDEHGEYPAGYWLKNPPGSGHTPSSPGGCLLFVKLCYQAAEDQRTARIDSRTAEWQPGRVPGLQVLPLDSYAAVHTALLRWAPGTRLQAQSHLGGAEVLVLEGVLEDEFGTYPVGTWLRIPPGSRHTPLSTAGCLTYVKLGHLREGAGSDQSSTFLSTS